ncbi:MAG: AIR synthase-related protein [Muribaculum sp.]|nr:AIR synthase-related protein [Muribaculum sp.]
MKTGRVTENVFKRSILQQIKTKRREVISGAGIGEDCALFAFDGPNNDSSVILSCVQEGTEPVASLMIKCANLLACRGGAAAAVALSILLPSETEEPTLKGIMAEAEETCGGLGIQIAQAQARVTAAVREPLIMATAYGAVLAEQREGLREASYHTVKAARPGQDVVVSKWIGLEGTAILAKRFGESLKARYPAWLPETAAGFDRYLSTVPEAAAAVQSNVCVLHNVSEGGIFAALWELAEGAGVGLTIDLKKLPIRQETVEVCNHCNVNPYTLLSGGCLLMTCADGTQLAEALEAERIPAAVVGKVTAGRDRLILNGEETRYLDRPQPDSLYEIGSIA